MHMHWKQVALCSVVALAIAACAEPTVYRRTAAVLQPAADLNALPFDQDRAEISAGVQHNGAGCGLWSCLGQLNYFPVEGDPAIYVANTAYWARGRVQLAKGFFIGGEFVYASAAALRPSAVEMPPLQDGHVKGGGGTFGFVHALPSSDYTLGASVSLLGLALPWERWAIDRTHCSLAFCDWQDYRREARDTDIRIRYRITPTFSLTAWPYVIPFAGLSIQNGYVNLGFSNEIHEGSTIDNDPGVVLFGGLRGQYKKLFAELALDMPLGYDAKAGVGGLGVIAGIGVKFGKPPQN